MTVDQTKQTILKNFDRKYTRVNLQTREYEEKWYIKECITARDIKTFISEALDHVEQEVKKEYEDELVRLRVYWKKRLEDMEKAVRKDNT